MRNLCDATQMCGIAQGELARIHFRGLGELLHYVGNITEKAISRLRSLKATPLPPSHIASHRRRRIIVVPRDKSIVPPCKFSDNISVGVIYVVRNGPLLHAHGELRPARVRLALICGSIRTAPLNNGAPILPLIVLVSIH